MKPYSILLVAVTCLFSTIGCDPAKETGGGGGAPTPPPAPASGGGGSASAPAPAVAAPSAPTTPADAGVAAAVAPPEVPQDKDVLKTIASLEVAAEYYNRSIVTMVPQDEEQQKNWKQPPPLTDLQQLVTYRVIRAVPPGPDGKKFVIDPKDGKVKVQ